MALGSAVHAGIEALFTSPLRSQAALRRSFAKETKGLPADEMGADPEALSDGLVMLATYTKERFPTYTPTMVERPFTVRLEGVLWTGIIDNADEKSDDVVDVKTTAGKTINGRKPNFTPESYDMQLTGYSFGYLALTGRKPKRLLLDVLKRSGKYQQYERQPKTAEFLNLVRLTRDAIMGRSFEPTGLLNGACAFCPFTEVCEFYVP
jgi:RecB family exonuclease